MKFGAWIVTVALMASVMPAHAQDRAPPLPGGTQSTPLPGGTTSAVGGTLALIYVVSGVRDDGAADSVGTATTFHCSNASTVSEQIQIVVRNFDGTIHGNDTSTVTSAHTTTKSTHGTAVTEDLPFLSPGTAINQGLAFIFATSPFVFCTALTVDAATPNQAVALHMVRFNPVGGSQE
jgi:hypothetical protein